MIRKSALIFWLVQLYCVISPGTGPKCAPARLPGGRPFELSLVPFCVPEPAKMSADAPL